MSPITHGLLGWLVANTTPLVRRDRAWVTLAGVAPDIDGLGAVAEIATKHSEQPLLWFSEYHHWLCHNLFTALIFTGIAAVFSVDRVRCAALCFLVFHLHLLCDILGARGPDGHQWPIWYFSPFSDAWPLTWSSQWALDSWINQVATGVAIIATLFLAWRSGFSPLELLSVRADSALVGALRRRFPRVSDVE